MRRFSIAGLAALLYLGFAAESRAGLQLIYSETFTDTGSYLVAGSPLVNITTPMSFTISLFGASAVQTGPGYTYVTGTAFLFSSLGTVQITDQFAVADIPNSGSPSSSMIAFVDTGQNNAALIEGDSAFFRTYNLGTLTPGAISVTSTTTAPSVTYSGTVVGSGASVLFTFGTPSSQSYFVASPEPSTMALAILGLGTLGIRFAGRTRKQSTGLAG